MGHSFHSKAFDTRVPDAFVVCLVLLSGLSGCRQQPIHLQGEAQGTYYSISYYDNQGRNLQGMTDSLLDDFDLTASLWKEQSLIRRLNANATDTMNPCFVDLLGKSMHTLSYTDGAFDYRVGKLVQEWGFSFKQRQEPSPQRIDTLLIFSHGDVVIDTLQGIPILRKQYPETEFDFNAIAQGYAVDLLARQYDALGIQNYLIDIGGEVIAKGCKPDGSPWRVGIERPAPDRNSQQTVEVAIELHDASVVTSGNYRKYYERAGVRYSHTINPATGYPVNHSLLSVSVVSREAWYADAMATAFMVMGLEKSKAFIAAHPDDPDIQAAFFIYDDGGSYKTYATPAFKKLINE